MNEKTTIIGDFKSNTGYVKMIKNEETRIIDSGNGYKVYGRINNKKVFSYNYKLDEGEKALERYNELLTELIIL